ncbi:MAG: DUF2298 domain-containing protein [Chloroflexaceae bacterium]
MGRWAYLWLLLLPALVVLILWQTAGGVTVQPTTWPHQSDLAGFAPPEAGPSGLWRWSIAPEARWLLPAGGLPGILTLRGVAAPGAGLEIEAGATRVALPPETTPPQLRRYALLVASPDPSGWLDLRIRAAPLATIEGRRLGLALAEVHIAPVTRPFRLPPLFAWLVIGGAPLLIAAALNLAGWPPRLAVFGSVAAGLALASVWAARPEAVEPLLRDVRALLDPLVLRWWLAAQAAGMAGLPFAWLLLRRLPLGGYPLAKIIGLFLISLGSWAIAVTGVAPFGLLLVATLWLGLLLGGWSLWVRASRAGNPPARLTWRALAGWELLFAAGLCAGTLLRWHGAVGPALTGTEKPMEMAILNAVLRYNRFPPLDPWFAGSGINYYYFGYVSVAALALVTATEAAYAFNLGFALIVALILTGVAYLAVALATLTPLARGRGAFGLALLAVMLTLGAGNQAAALHLLIGSHLARALDAGQLAEALVQRLGGAETLRLSRPVPPGWDGPGFDTIQSSAPATFDWFRPSRAVYDDVRLPDGSVERRYAITEFPAFSLYLGDLHPHVLAMPVNLLALALALALATGGAPIALAACAGVIVGALYSLNAWDAPTYGAICAGALLLGWRGAGGLDWRGALPGLAALTTGALLAALPFVLTFTPPAGAATGIRVAGIPLIGPFASAFGMAQNRTRLHSFLGMFGLFLLPILGLALRQSITGLSGRTLLALLPLSLVAGMLADFPLLFLLPLAALLARGAWQARSPATALAGWAGAVGALALLTPELVFIRDHLEGEMSRMITIFKFFYQGWLIWSLVAAYAVWRILRVGPRCRRDLLWSLPAAALLAGALVYPIGLHRAEPWRPGERTFDGLAFLAREAPDDLAAIRWLAANVAPEERVLTGFCNCDYERVSRVGALSGVQTLLGWLDGHERVWRSGRTDQMAEMARRERDIPAIYGAGDFATALALLHQHQITYVYFGPIERGLYGAASEQLFAANLPVAFRTPGVRIYRLGEGKHTPPAGGSGRVQPSQE